ncbi:hypothetical protein EV702DRAFT_1042605 [Suillus placidus]|uniref:Uncharacterized protein n=1 Tax=Suillus placidus TaxID=48579 RepID=A0A9P7A370_9AGAM|nr:hypothetical protein EV702DRAFT_1042605 [Suillus placidus]
MSGLPPSLCHGGLIEFSSKSGFSLVQVLLVASRRDISPLVAIVPSVTPETRMHAPVDTNFNPSFEPRLTFPDSTVSTPVSSTDEWIDTHQSIHVKPTEDGMCTSLSPPPPYVSHDPHYSEDEFSGTIAKTEDLVQDYLRSNLLSIDNTHTFFISDAVEAMHSFAHCQGQLIANDWDPNSDILSEEFNGPPESITPYPILGLRSERDWSERVKELIDHRAHARGVIALVKDTLPAQIITEAVRWPTILTCEEHYRMGTHIPASYYKSSYPPINPFFSDDETQHLFAIATIVEFHGEHKLASMIDDTLHMPYPDAYIVHALTQQNILDEQYGSDIIAFACACDRELEIQRVEFIMVSFQTKKGSQPVCFHFFSSQACEEDFDDDDFDCDADDPDDIECDRKDEDQDDKGPKGGPVFFL